MCGCLTTTGERFHMFLPKRRCWCLSATAMGIILIRRFSKDLPIIPGGVYSGFRGTPQSETVRSIGKRKRQGDIFETASVLADKRRMRRGHSTLYLPFHRLRSGVSGRVSGEENLPCRRSELVGLEGRIQTGIQ